MTEQELAAVMERVMRPSRQCSMLDQRKQAEADRAALLDHVDAQAAEIERLRVALVWSRSRCANDRRKRGA